VESGPSNIDAVAAGLDLPPLVAPGRRAAHPDVRTALLSLALVVAGVAALTRLEVFASPHRSGLQWWWIALLAIATEMMAFDIEFRREVYTFTFSEIPLVLGLFFAAPGHLIGGRLVGAALLLVLKERQPPRKLMLNLASFFAECVVLLTVYRLIGGGRWIDDPLSWVLALAAVAVADLLGFVVVAKVVRWHGGPLLLRSILSIGAVTAPVNTSLALAAGVLYFANAWATLLLCGIAAFLVLSYRSYSALGQRYQSLSMLYDFTRLVSGSQRADDVLEAVLVQAKDVMRAERAVLWLVDDRGHYLALSVDDERREQRSLPPETASTISAWFDEGRGAFVVTKDDEDASARAVAEVFGAHDCIVAPVVESGTLIGMVAVIDRLGESNGFSGREVPAFATLANHASVALENGRLLTRLHVQAREREHDALHDALTGLPNRAMFDIALREHVDALAPGDLIAVAVLDLDGFKEINDTLGHQSGDLVLVEVAGRLAGIGGPSVVVARLGGDEFALLLPRPTSREAVELTLRSIRREIASPVHISGVRINVGASIGVAIGPEHGAEGPVLLQRADVAMNGAKAGLGDGVNLYHPDTDTHSTRRLMLANDLHFAIENRELALVYQPKVRLDDAGLTGFEALLRWTHPRLGPVGPDEFIRLAERTGSIQQITVYVLETALRQAAAWQRDGHRWAIAINLSTRNLLDDDLVGVVARLLTESGAEPALVTLEITETSVMADADRAIVVLDQLAALGVRLSIDDFGTGYSSLSYLQRLPVHEVKIDKSFVMPMATDPSADSIVRSVLDLARNMGLTAVAEGVEDIATWHRLQSLRCTHAQGYFLARPMPPADIPAWAADLPTRGLEPDPVRRPAAAA
jgi:diguanylate cyclase (GGDEF)-like protein